jgi:M6 family metalloprotease-like protein
MGMALSHVAKAADTYDASTGILSIPLVKVDNNYYSNVQVTLGSVLSVGSTLSRALAYDVYNASNGQLLIPVVTTGGNTYFFVLVTVANVVSVGGDQHQPLKLMAPQPYRKTITANGPKVDPLANVVIPSNLTPPVANATLKVWISDPRAPTVGLVNSGIFVANASTLSFTYYGPSKDGAISVSLPDGNYVMDTTEPSGSTLFIRKRYSVSIQSGVALVASANSNTQGVFAVTLGLNNTSTSFKNLQTNVTTAATMNANSFVPNSACQLIDQVTANRTLSTQLSAGFPKVVSRASSFGRIRALIVPIDFPDVQGVDNPVTFFTPIAQQASNFYYAQSYGKLAFDFEIVPNWVRVPFASNLYNMGTPVSVPGQTKESAVGLGDPVGYLNALIAATDGPIDFSQYEEVYFLLPKEIPMSSIGWGPAITNANWTSTGVILNGATGSADMYYNEKNGISGATWKWLVHETGHTLGLYDEDYQHQSQTLGFFSVMAQSWTNNAFEMLTWDRYLQGWLPESQVACTTLNNLSKGPLTKILSPVERQDTQLKAVMTPLSGSKILVIESRKSEGYDTISPANQGVLVYTVDMTMGQLAGGYVMQKRTGSVLPSQEDGLLKANDQVVVGGVKITVMGLSSSGDTVKIEAAP